MNPKFNLEVMIALAKLEPVENHLAYVAPAGSGRINPDFSTDPDHQPNSELSRRMLIALLAFLVWIASVLFIAIVPAIALLPYLAASNISISDAAQIVEFAKSDINAILIQIGAILPAHLLTLAAAWVVVSQLKRYDFLKTLGWRHGGIKWWHYLLILGAFFAIAAAVNLVIPEQENELIRILRSSRWAVYVVAIIATFSAPLIEEVVYRGVLYSAFRNAAGTPAAFIAVTILFALVHVPQYYPSYSTILLLTLLSITLTALRAYSNNLLPCVILHTIFNGFQSLLLVLEPLIPKPVPDGVVPGIYFLLQ